MFQEEITTVQVAAESKVRLMRQRPTAYFILSMLAGIYVGVGILLIFTIGGTLNAGGFSGTKIVMGLSFGIALSLVIMAGSALFTGNNFVMAIGLWRKNISFSSALKLWCLFAFITTGFEHSIANMALLAIGVMNPMGYAVTVSGYLYNLFFVTLGNMIGGIALVAIPYAVVSGKEAKKLD